jgi:hypothetical protein
MTNNILVSSMLILESYRVRRRNMGCGLPVKSGFLRDLGLLRDEDGHGVNEDDFERVG